jgi:hypothetical protein
MKKRSAKECEDPRALLEGGEFSLWVPEIEAAYVCRSVDEADHFAERVEEVYGQIDGNLWFDFRKPFARAG